MAETSPHDLVAERAVLGGILVDNTQIEQAQQRLTPADFFRDVHKQVFASMVRLDVTAATLEQYRTERQAPQPVTRTGRGARTTGGPIVVNRALG